MRLPEEYENKMKRLLGNEYDAYVSSLSLPMYSCLRVNTLKVSVKEFLRISPFELTPVPWSSNSFYYDASECTPSKHPFYFAGLYYLQEPSATLPAATIDIEPGDKVLDICAAPGGKSTELACKLKGTGLLVSNDISASRLKALQKNIEIFGIRNSIITCEAPDKLAESFKGYFDKILIDAPCSGEGMFRKSSSMITAWKQNGNEKFIAIQKEILREVVKMLKPGGTILYSTCTFDPREDEDQVMYLKELDPGLHIEPIAKHDGFVDGNPQWSSCENADEKLSETVHLFPHKVKGEGHYVSLLKSDGERDNSSTASRYTIQKYKGNIPEINDFLSHVVSGINKDNLEYRNDKLYLIPEDSPSLPGMRIMRRGVYLGELKKKRFEPSQSFAMILSEKDFDNSISLKSDSTLCLKYLKGESLILEGYEEEFDKTPENGWTLVCVDHFPLGFAKMTNGTMKNKYLSGWRMMS